MKQSRPTIILSKLFDREPPKSVEAEMAVLGAVLINPAQLARVRELVPDGSAFTDQRHATIFDAVTRIVDALGTLDLVVLGDVLRTNETMESCGGMDYLFKLATEVPTQANALQYARMVRSAWDLRRMIQACGEAVYAAYATQKYDGAEAGALIEFAAGALADLAAGAGNAPDRPVPMSSLARDVTRVVLDPDAGSSLPVFTTGFDEVDAKMTGMQPGDLIVWAARPSMGKTSAMLCAAMNLVSRQNVSVLVVSLEMRREKLTHRMLSILSGVPLRSVRESNLDHKQVELLKWAEQRLTSMPVWVDDAPVRTVAQIAAIVREHKRRYGVEVVFIDYLQKVTPAANNNRESRRHDEVATISTALKTLARSLGVVVVCMAQLNRGPEAREDKRPRLSDLGESSQIEKDADAVVMIHREWYYRGGDPAWASDNAEKRTHAEFIVAKCRDGETGAVPVNWTPETTRFYGLPTVDQLLLPI